VVRLSTSEVLIRTTGIMPARDVTSRRGVRGT